MNRAKNSRRFAPGEVNDRNRERERFPLLGHLPVEGECRGGKGNDRRHQQNDD